MAPQSAAAVEFLRGDQHRWSDGTVPEHLAPPAERFLAPHLAKRLQEALLPRHQTILGPRQTGKTTVMHQVVRRLLNDGVPPGQILWARLDHPMLAGVPFKDLADEFLRSAEASREKPLYLFLDELAGVPDWDLWLKTFYDERWPVRVLASSSSTAALRQGRIESGIGRWEDWSLPPCGLAEALVLDGAEVDPAPGGFLRESLEALAGVMPRPSGLDAMRRRLVLLGGFPGLLVGDGEPGRDGEPDPALFLRAQRAIRSDVIVRAVYKDLAPSFRIRNPMVVEHLLHILAGQMTGLLSPTSLAGTIPDVKLPTLERYLGHLVQTWMVFTLPNYAPPEETVRRRGRKAYFIDGAVRNAALRLDFKAVGDPDQLGRLHENLAAAHLRSLGERTGAWVYHWRKGRDEVALVYDDRVGPLAFEIGSASAHGRSGLLRFLDANPRFRGGCYYVAPSLPFRAATATETGIGELPLDMLLLAAGMQERAALARGFGG